MLTRDLFAVAFSCYIRQEDYVLRLCVCLKNVVDDF